MRGVLFPGLALGLATMACAAGNQPIPSSANGNRATALLSDADYSRIAGEQVHRIAGDELRQLIPGTTISRRRPEGREEGRQVDVSVPSYDIFNRDGSYIRGVENGRAHGTYTISGDSVCSRTPALTRCRRFFRGLSGYYFVYFDAPDTILPISIQHQ